MKCIVECCPNKKSEGIGFDLDVKQDKGGALLKKWICFPCMTFLIGGKIENSAIQNQFVKRLKGRLVNFNE